MLIKLIPKSKENGAISIEALTVMAGFGKFELAKRYCQAFDEVRHFLRPRQKMGEYLSLSERRERWQQRVVELEMLFKAA